MFSEMGVWQKQPGASLRCHIPNQNHNTFLYPVTFQGIFCVKCHGKKTSGGNLSLFPRPFSSAFLFLRPERLVENKRGTRMFTLGAVSRKTQMAG